MPYAPLSPTQRLLCWVDEVAPGNIFGPRFVSVVGYRISGPLDREVLQGALDDLVVRHEGLRTVVVRDGGSAYQRVHQPAPVPLVEVDPERLVETVATGDFRYGSIPALWAFLARHNATEATLVLAAHHTAVDPWSMRILIGELLGTYADRLAVGGGATPTAPPAAAGNGRPGRDRRAAAETLDYWRRVLDNAPGLPLPTPRPGGTAGTADVVAAVPVTDASLRAVSRPLRTTPFVLQLATFVDALAAVTGADEVTVPVLTYGRDRSEWGTVGLFMNAVPVRVRADGGGAAEVRTAFHAAYAREVPVADLLSEVPEAVRFFAPGGPVSAQFEVIQLPPERQGGPLAHRPVRIPTGLGGPVIPINGMVAWLEPEADGAYRAIIRYRCDLFPAATVERLAERFVARLAEVARS